MTASQAKILTGKPLFFPKTVFTATADSPGTRPDPQALFDLLGMHPTPLTLLPFKHPAPMLALQEGSTPS